MKDDERRFLLDVYRRGKTPRNLISEPGFFMHHKRAWYLLDKWTAKGWYDYGVSLDLGWLTEEGKQKAQELEEPKDD